MTLGSSRDKLLPIPAEAPAQPKNRGAGVPLRSVGRASSEATCQNVKSKREDELFSSLEAIQSSVTELITKKDFSAGLQELSNKTKASTDALEERVQRHFGDFQTRMCEDLHQLIQPQFVCGACGVSLRNSGTMSNGATAEANVVQRTRPASILPSSMVSSLAAMAPPNTEMASQRSPPIDSEGEESMWPLLGSRNGTDMAPRPHTSRLSIENGPSRILRPSSVADDVDQPTWPLSHLKFDSPLDPTSLDELPTRRHTTNGVPAATRSHRRKSSRVSVMATDTFRPSQRLFPRNNTQEVLEEEEEEVSIPIVQSNGGRVLPLKSCLTDYVRGETFHFVSSAVTILYTVSVGLETDYMARNWDHPDLQSFMYLDIFFGVFFVVEMILRMFTGGKRFFSGLFWKDNLFDLVLVIVQLSELFATYCYAGQDIALLRPLKLFRSMRLIRVLNLIDELRTLTVSILSSMRSFFWSLLLLVLATFFMGVILTDLVTHSRRRLTLLSYFNEKESLETQIEEFYGNLYLTMLNLYQTASEGRHWCELAEPIMTLCSPWLGILFAFYVSFMIFAMLNVLTAFFVESTLRVAEEDKKRFMMSELWTVFRPLDDTTDTQVERSITLDEFQSHLDNPKMQPFLDAEELVSGCLRLTGMSKSFDVLSLAHDYREDSRESKQHNFLVENALKRLEVQFAEVREVVEKHLQRH
eukprot:TRINITY_DN2264_c1_g1_i2.p1 TRINITY_DN2264_c1_g1~~TRINITY_DN2264_c1_g1_i2.p1  ORF type:complete len:713 (-),score=123.48 TRINITY_DN2264_c1_g1_i2:39-2132(-)